MSRAITSPARSEEISRAVVVLTSATGDEHLARDLAIGEQTVKTHVRSILTKLGLQDRVQAAIFALRHQPSNGEHRP